MKMKYSNLMVFLYFKALFGSVKEKKRKDGKGKEGDFIFQYLVDERK